jgi:hypothetical protein
MVKIRYKNWCGAKFVEDPTKKLFSDGIKKTCDETLESVR